MSTFIQGPIPNSLKSAEFGNLGWGSGKLLLLRNQTKPWESILQILNFNFLSSQTLFPLRKTLSLLLSKLSSDDPMFLWIWLLFLTVWYTIYKKGGVMNCKSLMQYWPFRMLHLPPGSHGAFLLRHWGKDNFKFPGPHELWCEYDPRDGVCVIPALNTIKISHFYGLKKGHKHHLTPLVWFIWGNSCLSNSPTWNNNRGGMGWVCASGKGSFFLSYTKLFSSPVVIPFLSSLIDALL